MSFSDLTGSLRAAVAVKETVASLGRSICITLAELLPIDLGPLPLSAPLVAIPEANLAVIRIAEGYLNVWALLVRLAPALLAQEIIRAIR